MSRTGWRTNGTAATLALCLGTAAAHGQMVRVAQSEDVTQPAAITAAYDPQQTRDDLLDGLDRLGANAKERNEVNLDRNTLALAGGRRGGRYGDLAQKIDMITVRNYEFAQKGQYQRSDLDPLRHRLDGNGWSHIVRNESGDELNDIVVKGDHDGFLSDVVILNAESKELNIVHLHGHFRMEDVQGAMGSAMGAMGASMGAMGSAMGRVAAAQHQPPAPPPPPTSTDSKH